MLAPTGSVIAPAQLHAVARIVEEPDRVAARCLECGAELLDRALHRALVAIGLQAHLEAELLERATISSASRGGFASEEALYAPLPATSAMRRPDDAAAAVPAGSSARSAGTAAEAIGRKPPSAPAGTAKAGCGSSPA
ncbi:MAG: hypothetical protein U1F11_04855 [Steroidobacteraceae bacterium]